MLDLLEELDGVHDTFHVSNFKKSLANPTLQVPLDEIQVDAKLSFMEEPMKILEREFKKLKQSIIAIVKVRWNSKRGPEFMWEREDQMKLKYPHLFSDILYHVDSGDFVESYGDDNHDGDQPETSNPTPPIPPLTQQIPHTISSIKLPILKKGEYDIWTMKMEHYLSHTDYPIWQVIKNSNGPVSVITDTNGTIKILPPKTAEEVVARERERKARTTLLMALHEDHLEKFHKMSDAKEMWEAIKSRFGGNDESKKMHKYLLKQQFEGFSVSASEGLYKRHDRFQTLLSQLEIHGGGVSHEDANQKF
nr:ribonuclease H-like domain-containing protein [Tanacetum cinerariifolium]